MDRNALVNALQSEGNLKHSFDAAEIERLAAHMSIETIVNEAIVMRKGEPADSMIFIIDGLVQILDGDRQLALQKAGDFLGESL